PLGQSAGLNESAQQVGCRHAFPDREYSYPVGRPKLPQNSLRQIGSVLATSRQDVHGIVKRHSLDPATEPPLYRLLPRRLNLGDRITQGEHDTNLQAAQLLA